MTLDEAVQKLGGPRTRRSRSDRRRGLDAPLARDHPRRDPADHGALRLHDRASGTGYILISDFARLDWRRGRQGARESPRPGHESGCWWTCATTAAGCSIAIDVARPVRQGSRIVETRGRTKDSFQQFDAAGDRPAGRAGGGAGQRRYRLGGRNPLGRHSGPRHGHDRGRADLGQGPAQTVYGLSYGAGLALTTAKYYTRRAVRSSATTARISTTLHVRPDDDSTPLPPVDPERRVLTDLGREVYGGGGIAPDVEVEPTDVPPYLQFLLARAAFFDFAVDYARGNQLPDHPGGRTRCWSSSRAGWSRKIGTKKWSQRGLRIPPASSPCARSAPRPQRRSVSGRAPALTDGDRQIQAALKLFDRAAALLVSRQEQGAPKPPASSGTPLG
jgi:carboxyl-terminal processing protease